MRKILLSFIFMSLMVAHDVSAYDIFDSNIFDNETDNEELDDDYSSEDTVDGGDMPLPGFMQTMAGCAFVYLLYAMYKARK